MDRYIALLATAQSDGAAVTNTTTTTTLLPGNAKPVIPGGFLFYIGQELIVEAAGRISNQSGGGGGGGTITFLINKGSTTVAQSSAYAVNVSNTVNQTWRLRWDLTLRSVGSAATFMHTGWVMSQTFVGGPGVTVGGDVCMLIPSATPAVGASFDSRTDEAFDLLVSWSAAQPSNSIQLHQYKLISLN